MAAGAQPVHGLGEVQSILQIKILYGELHHYHQQEGPRGAGNYGDFSNREGRDGHCSSRTT